MIVEDVSGRCLAMAYRSYSFVDGWKLEDSASLGSYGVHGVVDWMYNSVSLLFFVERLMLSAIASEFKNI